MTLLLITFKTTFADLTALTNTNFCQIIQRQQMTELAFGKGKSSIERTLSACIALVNMVIEIHPQFLISNMEMSRNMDSSRYDLH